MTRKEAYESVKMWTANDWDLKEETPDYFVMRKNTSSGWGHFWIFIFTFWFTLGLGNIAYYFLSYKTKKILK